MSLMRKDLCVRAYTEADAAGWDGLVARSPVGTFQHTRRFLAYHQSRFADASCVVENGSGLLAVFPAALDPTDETRVVSHPGATYGGLVYDGDCTAAEVLRIFEQLTVFYRKSCREVLVRSVPAHIQPQLGQVDQYAMWRVNASVYRRDLWSVIDLTRPRKISRHHARAIRKGGARVAVRRDAGDEAYSELHRVVVDSLARRHGVKPVHTLDELRLLRDLFPDSIDLWIAEDHLDMVVAAVWVFRFQSRCWHAQYIAADLAGMELNATHLVLESIANAALAESVQYFSMGCGTEDGGAILNAGLFDFKSGFGFGSVIQDFYRIDLTSL